VWRARCGDASFYRGERWPWRSWQVVDGVVVPMPRRGKEWARWVGNVKAMLTRVVVRPEEDGAGRHRHRSLQYGGGQSSSVTTATGRARSGERVHWVPDVEVSVQVQGEVKASAESTGHGDILSRSGASLCASWRAWASLGVSGRAGPGQC
jgi:hypothetical protein